MVFPSWNTGISCAQVLRPPNGSIARAKPDQMSPMGLKPALPTAVHSGDPNSIAAHLQSKISAQH